MFRAICLLAVIILAVPRSHAETPSVSPVHRAYTTIYSDAIFGKLSGADIAVRKDGLVGIATTRGVMLFDGERWTVFEHPERQMCLALAVDKHDRFIVGFSGDIGVLTRDRDGSMNFRSFRQDVMKERPDLQPCNSVVMADDRCYFVSLSYAVAWNIDEAEEGLRVFDCHMEGRATCYSIINGQLRAVVEKPNGKGHVILELGDEGFHEIANLADRKGPRDVAIDYRQLSNGEELIAYWQNGIYRLTAGEMQPLGEQLNAVVASWRIRGLQVLRDDRLVVLTESGVIFCDKNGKILDTIDAKAFDDFGGCRNRGCIDQSQSLWIPSTGPGIAVRIDLQSYVWRWRPRIVALNWVAREANQIWAGGTGRILMNSMEAIDPESIEIEVPQSLNVVYARKQHLFSTTSGLIVHEPNGKTDTIAKGRHFTSGAVLPDEEHVIYGSFGNMQLIEWKEEQWMLRGPIAGSPLESFEVVHDPSRDLVWYTTRPETGIWYLCRQRFENGDHQKLCDLVEFPQLKAATRLSIIRWGNRILFNSMDGLVEYNDQSGSFVPANVAFDHPQDARHVGAMGVDSLGCLWLAIRGKGVFRFSSAGKVTVPAVIASLEKVYRIQCATSGDDILFITDLGEVFGVSEQPFQLPDEPPSIISLASIAKPAKSNGLDRRNFTQAPIEFQFASRGFGLHSSGRYQYRLDGFEDSWSPWTNESRQVFQALRPGHYEFQVRARRNDFEVGPIASIAFDVPAPWYSTWWARGLYGLCLVGLMLSFASWRSRVISARATQLERNVKERTAELEMAKLDLENRVRRRTHDLQESNQRLLSEVEFRRIAERELQESELRYRTIVEGQTEMIVRLDEKGKIIYANDAYCRNYDRPSEDIVGYDFFEGMDPKLKAMAEHSHAGHDAQEVARSSVRQRIKRGESTEWEDWTIRAFFDRQGQFMAYQAVGRNMTALVETQEMLRQKEEYLRHASRLSMLGEMVASITHELRQPLGSISNFAFASMNSLEGIDAQSAEQISRWNQQIVEQIARADTIVRRLRGFARRADTELESCNVNAVILDTISMLQFELRRAHVVVTTELADGLPAIRFVRVQLEQVLVNLIRNSCDALESTSLNDRRILLKTSLDGEAICVSVTDNGHGIPESQLSQLFQAFHSTKKDGLGLGLAISRSIIEDCGGRIWATRETTGITIAFTLFGIPTSDI